MTEQGSPEWFAERCGKVTGSRISDVMAKGRGGAPSAIRENYIAQIVAERLTGVVQKTFISPAMQWGTECEPLARAAYESYKGVLVVQTGMIQHPRIEQSGASPDGLVLDDGLVEFKCPETKTHINYIIDGDVPKEYIYQMQWQMACTQREWCDFVSFDPRMPSNMQMFVTRFAKDEQLIEQIEHEVNKFLEEVEQTIESLNKKVFEWHQ